MKKKGFTLVELLAVIVVLAVVLVISIPVIKNVIDNAKKGALKNSVYGIIDSAGYYYNSYMSEDSDLRILSFNNNQQTDEYEKLNYKGSIDHGFVAITPYADIAVCIDNGKWYAKKDINSNDVILDNGICTDDFDKDFMGFVTTGTPSYIGTRLSVTAYESTDVMPKKSGEGYIGIITNTKITDYYFSNDGIENPKEGNVWIVQNSDADNVIKNDKSKLGVACVMQYEDGKWQPKESYVFNDNKWVLLSEFDDLSGYAWEYDYTGQYQTFTAPYSGLYNVELWGAQGYTINASMYGGKGAYTAGYLYLDEGESIYVYVGGTTTTATGGWNGGGNGYAYRGGGGATDVRTVATSAETIWNELASLNSRIMVAAGGGGASNYSTDYYGYGAAGGGLEGITSIAVGAGALALQSTPATQGGGGIASGYYAGQDGRFGIGGNSYQNWQGNGGGGGWYGGAGISYVGGHNSGGSSYISGHQGCGSVDKNGQANGETVSWTGKYFTNTKMIDGTGYEWTKVKGEYIKMPNKSGSGEVDGNEGNGYAKISLVTPIYKSEETRNKEIAELNTYWSYGAAVNYQTFTAPANGTYRFELWGAQGGSINTYLGGLGAYTKGDIYLEKGTKLYFYVGHQGTKNGSWNGGGSGYASAINTSGGGGATDVRSVGTSPSTTWDEITSLRSRIMVAASGAGASNYSADYFAYGGAGGGLKGLMGSGGTSATNNKSGTLAGQGLPGTSFTYYAGQNGDFGKGGNGYQNWQGNGGGSGWYGAAGGSYVSSVIAGGSSYISGHLGCDSLNEDGVHNGSAYSYTGYIFTDTEMIDGEGYEWTIDRKGKVNMKQHLTSEMVAGNSGNGYARVMLVKKETKNNYAENIINSESTWTYWGAATYQPFIAPITGTYKIELWGASGGSLNSTIKGGLGGYTKGEIRLEKGTKLYLFVGGQGGHGTNAGYNGGGAGYGAGGGFGYAGGGATDIRVIGDGLEWNNATSLYSRIMVAAGGAGASSYNGADWTAWDGAGGGLEGILGNGGASAMSYKVSRLPNQTVGGISYTAYHPGTAGAFGVGGNGYQNYSCNGGGGGWYGAAGGAHVGSVSSGGSSYISGHNGCIAVDNTGTPVATTASSVSDSYSYTGYKFTSTKMIDGEGYKWTTERGGLTQMPTHDGTTVMTGNEGDGFAKITFVR